MPYEQRPGQGSAFKNKNKTLDWHPEYKGDITLPDGSLHWLDVKVGKTKAGDYWFSIKIGNQKMGVPAAPTMRPIDAHSQAKGNAFIADNDDDIPF
jgi:hypothetical protein